MAEAETLINDLQTITEDLKKAVKSYQVHLDEDVARYDRGPHSADAGVTGGEASIMQTAVRKAFAVRALASVGGPVPIDDRVVQPGFLADSGEIQSLILAARKRIDDSDAVNNWLLQVSARELTGPIAKAKQVRHAQLQKAREAAETVAIRALGELPIPLPEDDASRETTFEDLFIGRAGLPQAPPGSLSGPSQQKSLNAVSEALPLHWEPGRLTTLINEHGYRMALSDLGTKDSQGRHTFYQVEWVQRGRIVLLMGQLVGVNTSNGQHVLIKRYPLREVPGQLEDVYTLANFNETRSATAPDIEPSREEVESALAEVTRLNTELPAARQRFTIALGTGLARSDQRLREKGGEPLDTGLPEGMRMQLYAIRGHLLGAPSVLDAENHLRDETHEAEKRVEQLKHLAAWANRSTAEEHGRANLPVPEWDRLQSKADDNIYTSRQVIASTLAALPPDVPDQNAKFPGLSENSIVRMVGVRASPGPGRAVWQEVWYLDPSATSQRKALQEIDIIVVDPETGDQIPIRHQSKSYPVESNENLVDAYERLGGPVAPPLKIVVPADLFRSEGRSPLPRSLSRRWGIQFQAG